MTNARRFHEDGNRNRDGNRREVRRDAPMAQAAAVGDKIEGHVRDLKDGFGFIKGDDGVDYFFHKSSMDRTGRPFHDLVIGDRGAFEVGTGAKGPRAESVRFD